MIINTKSTSNLPIPQNYFNRYLLSCKIDKMISVFEEEIKKKLSTSEWVEINNGYYYYIPEDGLVIPNTKKVLLSPTRFISLNILDWKPMVWWIARKWFHEKRTINPLIQNNIINYRFAEGEDEVEKMVRYVYCEDNKKLMEINSASTASWGISDSDGIKLPIYVLDKEEKENFLFFLLKYKLSINCDEEMSPIHAFLEHLFDTKIVQKIGEKLVAKIDSENDYERVYCDLKRLGEAFNPEDPEYVREFCNEKIVFGKTEIDFLVKELLDCDKQRINMESYPENILYDPESGHWGLWENGNEKYTAEASCSLVARNPVYDALENKSGVIGIDFGTKSTVVMYRQSRADVLPMRIGSGQYSRAVSKEDYENPTVMELRNVKKFMYDYKLFKGRPNTSWEDLLISHEASEQLKSEQSCGDTFASFFCELKQWASDKSRQIRLRDLLGNELNISSYISLNEDDFDPIEIYAYYLGLFINNMIHKIYLRYKLSFPATVEKQVRDKILCSFTRGIRKSLPTQVLENDACMSIFKVEQGASEPAAYAITALYEYGFDPEEDEKVYYGIFDFGGGTTDFDFGVWSSEEQEPENYDYQISHFGQGGDPYLGGENLLEILSYHVFIKNYDKLLQDKIVFIRPFGEKEIAGKDYLVCQDSQYAHFNQKRMMEKLRGVWEGKKETRETIKSGSIVLPLFTMDGESKSNYSLEVDLEELDQILENRIEKGVSQFFEALKNCFGVDKYQKDIHNVEGINIFLAGNSSKSPLVYKLFKKYIDIFNSGLAAREGENKEWFKVYPPLGIDIADKIIHGDLCPNIDEILEFINKSEAKENEENNSQSENTYVDDEALKPEDLNKPTGKTGVAYGLLNNRVRVVQNENDEIGFRYYIGQNRKNKFYCAIDKDIQKYNEWVRFCTASKEDFDIWFTRSAAAPTNKMSIDQIGVYSEVGFVSEPSSEKSVYIRLISPTEIEYVVANEEQIKNDSIDEGLIKKVLLQEKQ